MEPLLEGRPLAIIAAILLAPFIALAVFIIIQLLSDEDLEL